MSAPVDCRPKADRQESTHSGLSQSDLTQGVGVGSNPHSPPNDRHHHGGARCSDEGEGELRAGPFESERMRGRSSTRPPTQDPYTRTSPYLWRSSSEGALDPRRYPPASASARLGCDAEGNPVHVVDDDGEEDQQSDPDTAACHPSPLTLAACFDPLPTSATHLRIGCPIGGLRVVR
jgi:hypothetical protein